MKLKAHLILQSEMQEWLDKYQDKVKFIYQTNSAHDTNKVMIVIDEE